MSQHTLTDYDCVLRTEDITLLEIDDIAFEQGENVVVESRNAV